MFLPDISDHFPMFVQVRKLGDLSDNDDSYVTIQCRLKTSERELLFRSLLNTFNTRFIVGLVMLICCVGHLYLTL